VGFPGCLCSAPARAFAACHPDSLSSGLAAGPGRVPLTVHAGHRCDVLGSLRFVRRKGARTNVDTSWTIDPLRSSGRRTAASQPLVFPHAEEGNRTPKGVSPGDFESIPTTDSSVEHEPRRCFYSMAAARALRPFMACAVEKADKTRTAAFYLAPARAPRSHGQFTDSAEIVSCSCAVLSAQAIHNPMTVPPRAPSPESSRAFLAAHHPRQPVPSRPTPPGSIVRDACGPSSSLLCS
jgi:hypothetical protein